MHSKYRTYEEDTSTAGKYRTYEDTPTYYFQLRAKPPVAHITAITPGKWDRWMEDWAIVRVDAHDHLVLPTEAPMGKRDSWVEVPRLPVPFVPVVERIKLLVDRGLPSMMVLFNFLLRRIAPLQMCVRLVWQYTGEGGTTWLERSLGLGLSPDVLSTLLGKLSVEHLCRVLTNVASALFLNSNASLC
jgi:hypothetical protein